MFFPVHVKTIHSFGPDRVAPSSGLLVDSSDRAADCGGKLSCRAIAQGKHRQNPVGAKKFLLHFGQPVQNRFSGRPAEFMNERQRHKTIFLHRHVTLGKNPRMKLDDAQKRQVEQWIKQGLKLSEIQSRLGNELGLRLTYMEVRLLVDDLKLTPVDPIPPKEEAKLPQSAPPQGGPDKHSQVTNDKDIGHKNPNTPGNVAVTVDQIARPGALVSGKVTFSDGQQADWTLDQTGRLGLAPLQKGYRPSAIDVEQFQIGLQSELAKLGF
jgi:transposase